MTLFPGYGIPMLKIRRSQERLIFNMGILYWLRRHLYVETAPGSSQYLAMAENTYMTFCVFKIFEHAGTWLIKPAIIMHAVRSYIAIKFIGENIQQYN